MSKFDKDSLKNLQDLCKIKLSEKEEIEFLNKLKQILDYVELLEEINTENVNACNYVLKDMQQNIFREDEIEITLDRETFLSNAPDQIAGMIKVPEILSQKD
jgi:aspartyl-tRNA(Asn)/glutamyl-tRNA(Gln) amidotransferase subunit C